MKPSTTARSSISSVNRAVKPTRASCQAGGSAGIREGLLALVAAERAANLLGFAEGAVAGVDGVLRSLAEVPRGEHDESVHEQDLKGPLETVDRALRVGVDHAEGVDADSRADDHRDGTAHAAGDHQEVQEVRGVAGHAEGKISVGFVAAFLLGSVGALRVGRHQPASGRRDAEGTSPTDSGTGPRRERALGGVTRRRDDADAKDARARASPRARRRPQRTSRWGVRASPRNLRPVK